MENNINVFKNLQDLRNACEKEYVNCYGSDNSHHYRRHVVSFKGSRYEPYGHRMRKVVEDGYDEACIMRNANHARWLKKYREMHADRLSYDKMRKCSLWLDDNHRYLAGYHDVDTDTKYCPLHLKNENPYLFLGIEVEITFDDEVVDGYDGDRFDEDGDYDDYGDYDCDGNYIPDTYDFEVADIAREFMKRAKGIFTCEEDGSLQHGYSFEAVSRPLSPAAWHDQTIIDAMKDAFDYVKSKGAMANQPSGNGFHIHVSKRFFEANPACNRRLDDVARDMNWVFQKFQNEIEMIGGREYNEWCASAVSSAKMALANNYGITIEKAHLEKKSLSLPYGDHRKAFIDSSSGYTYEARVFHSTLDVERILACIEFMRNISHGARENALEGKTFGQILRYKNAPNLMSVVKKIKAEKKLSLGKRNTNAIAL